MIYRPLGYEQITDVSSAVGLTIPETANRALIQPTAKNVRWRDDGEEPSATVGMQIAAGSTMAYEGDLSALSFIQEDTGAVLNVSYYTNWYYAE